MALAIAQNNIVPPIVVKAPNKSSHFMARGPNQMISRTDINRSGSTTFTEILQHLGGVQLQNMAGNNSRVGISMRGFGTNATSNSLLLINGIPMTNPDLAPPDLNAIPLEDIERVEITAGSESVLYGDQAVGGIINVITQDDPIPSTDMSCNAGSYQQRYCALSLRNKKQRSNYAINLSRFSSDNYREHNDNNQNTLFGLINYRHSNGHINLRYKLTDENMLYPGALSAAQVRQNRRQSNNTTDFFHDWNGLVHLEEIQQINPSMEAHLDLAHRQMNGYGTLTSHFTQSRMTDFLKPQLKFVVAQTNFMTGGELQNDSYQLNSLYGRTQETQQKFGLFFLMDRQIAPNWQATLGGRAAQMNSDLSSSFNNNDNINRAFATSIGTSKKILNGMEWYLRRAENFRFPKADENAATNTGSGLRTQRGASYETGFRYDTPSYSYQLDIYQLNLTDEIAYDPLQTAQNPFGSNNNLPPTVRRGFTFSSKYQPYYKLTFGGQYHYVNARFQSGLNSGNRIPLVSENMVQLSADYLLRENTHLYLESLYTGNFYAANDNANLAGKIGGYSLFNLHLNYKFKRFSTALRINNLLNQYYYFYVVTQPGMPDEFFYPAPTRNFVFTLSYHFE